MAKKDFIGMKSHATKEQCFSCSGLPEQMREAFYKGWYASGDQICEGEDSDWLTERLREDDFLTPRDEPEEY